MNDYKVCVYAICKNEEKFVDRWYNSMKEADYIVVLDTGSTDNTVSLLQRKDKVVVQQKVISPWRFDAARNESLKLIPDDTDICVCTDLDEILQEGWAAKLKAKWRNDVTRAKYTYIWSFDSLGRPGVTFTYEKIHKPNEYKWDHAVHEVLVRTVDSPEVAVEIPEIILEHHADPTKSRSSYLPLLELDVKERPEDDKRAKFHVMAYKGDPNYTEDGSMGDYVAVECPRCYYKREGDELIISSYRYPGYRAFDIFCHNHNQNDTMEFYYMPAYALALKDGHAVSLPNLDNEQGGWATLYNKAKTYNNEEIAELAQLMPAAVNFYEWALMTVEFATQNMQSIMAGCCALRGADSIAGTFMEGLEYFIAPRPTATQTNYTSGYVKGQYLAITKTTGHTNANWQPTHQIIDDPVRCDANGNESTSGSYVKLHLLNLGKEYSFMPYNTTDTWYIASRYYRTGECSEVKTPSGSPVNNTNGYYPMQYRYHENVYGNQYHTSADLFDVALIIPDSTTTSVNVKYGASLDWYYLPDPTSITTAVDFANNTTSLSTDGRLIKLRVNTPSEKYATGYIVSKQYDIEFPDIWVPETTEGGSNTTFYADQAFLVTSSLCRSVRFGGHWSYGSSAGPSDMHAYYQPSLASAHYGGDLYFPQ